MKTDAQHLADMIADLNDKRHGTRRGVELGCKCRLCSSKREEILAEDREKRRAKRREKAAAAKPKPKRKAPRKPSKDVCTVAAMLLPMMGKPSIDNAEHFCCVCGKPATDRHHIVKRSAGKLVVDGVEVKKPTVRLCGEGNASGCHGLAHAGKLHFRWVDEQAFRNAKANGTSAHYAIGGHWECLLLDEGTDYLTALSMDGWRRL